MCFYCPNILFVYISVKQKINHYHSISTTMYGIPQNSHLGAAVWWEERKLRKSCIRSGDEEPVFVLTVRRESSGSVNKTIQILNTHSPSRALIGTVTRARLDQDTFALCIRTAGCWDGRVGNGGQRDRRGCGLHPDRFHRTPRCQKLAGAEGYVIFQWGLKFL